MCILLIFLFNYSREYRQFLIIFPQYIVIADPDTHNNIGVGIIKQTFSLFVIYFLFFSFFIRMFMLNLYLMTTIHILFKFLITKKTQNHYLLFNLMIIYDVCFQNKELNV